MTIFQRKSSLTKVNRLAYFLFSIVIALSTACKDDSETDPKVFLLKESGFEKNFGGTSEDMAYSIVEKDEFIYSFGFSKSFGEPNGDHYLVKTDLRGNLIWEKTYGGTAREEGYRIKKSTDGNLFLLGVTESSGSGETDIHVLKVDIDGHVLWETVVGGSNRDSPATLIETKNSELLIAASTESFGKGSADIYLVWLASNGTFLRQKTHGERLLDGSSDVLELANGELMLFGYTNNYGTASRDFYLLKLTAQGDSIWGKRYGGNNSYEEAHQLLRTANGNFLLHGHSSKTDPNHNMYSVLVDSTGTLIWEREFGGNQHDGGQSAIINSAGNFVLLGRSMSFGNQQQLLFVELAQNGNLIHQEDIGSSKNERADDIIEVNDSYYIAGHSDNYGSGDNDVYLIKKVK